MRRLTLALLAALALPALAGCAKTGESSMSDSSKGVRQQVQVDAGGGKVVVKLALENGSAAPVYVPKALFEDDQLFRREFEITDQATGAQVDYTGPMVKRGPFTRADYLPVKPGAKITHSIDITPSYDFKPGKTYVLSYQGGYLPDVARLDAPAAAPVAPLTFTVK